MLPTQVPPPALTRSFRERGHWRDQLVGSFLPLAARRDPARLAVVAGPGRLSFGELDAQVSALAAALARAGISPGDVVSFQMPNSLEAVIAFHAIMKAGAVACPVVPTYRAREVAFILRQAQASLAFIPAHHRGFNFPQLYADLLPELPGLRRIVVAGPEAKMPPGPRFTSWRDFTASGAAAAALPDPSPPDLAPPDPDLLDPVRADDVCLVVYTSGTTAEPKGVLHSHNTLVYETRSLIGLLGLTSADVIFNPLPVTHMAGVVHALLMPALTGGPVVLQDRWDPAAAFELICAERATFMALPGPLLQGVLEAARAAGTARRPDAVRCIVSGGSDIPDVLATETERLLGPVVRMYGASEGPSVTCSRPGDDRWLRLHTNGRPVAPTEVAVVAAGRDDAEPGEVLWRGPDTCLGYLDPALNAAAFTADGFFRSGDIGRLDEHGALHIDGRIKDIVNRSGEKVSVAEVESLLSEHPAVLAAAIVGGPDAQTGERSCAFVVLRAGTELTLAAVEAFLTGRQLARHKIPESLILLGRLPQTASGKVQKNVLRDWLRDPAHLPAPMRDIVIGVVQDRVR